MNKKLFLSIGLSCLPLLGMADVIISFPAGVTGEFEVETQAISNAVKPRSQRQSPKVETLKPINGQSVFKQNQEEAAMSNLILSDKDYLTFYTMPGETLSISIQSLQPLEYTVTGSKLMEGISSLRPKAESLEKEYRALAHSSDPDGGRMEAIQIEYDKMFKDYIAANPGNPAIVYAVLQLDGEDFMTVFEALPETVYATALYPVAKNKKANVEAQLEADRKLAALQSGDVDAPPFTLKNLEGVDVSLSDFKGKWVILDFWGSWCPWCIKGFPALKEAYSKNAGRLEVVGIDCNDKEDVWREAVKKYELPWVNVYNPETGAKALYDAYAVTAFPTKVVVSPEGKIVNITVGEDPSFFSNLEELMNK